MTRDDMQHLAATRHKAGKSTMLPPNIAADIAGVPVGTVYKWRQRGKIRTYGRLVDVGDVIKRAKKLPS